MAKQDDTLQFIEIDPVEILEEVDLDTLEISLAEFEKSEESIFDTVKTAEGVNPEGKVPVGLTEIEKLITPVDDSVEYLTWVIYGKNGTGKTTLLSTADNMLILASEDGTLSIRGKADNAMKVKVDDWSTVEGVYWLLKGGKQTKGGIEINTASGKFLVKYLAIDTVTRLVDVAMREVILGEKAKDSSKDVLRRTQSNWGEMNEKMKYWLQKFKELPIQNVWLHQEMSNSTADIDSDEFSISPALNPGLSTYILSEADVIARMYIANTPSGISYRINASPNATYVTKDRTRKLNKAPINNPDLTKMYNLVFK